MSPWRLGVGAVAGLFTMGLVVFVIESLGQVFVPEGLDFDDPSQLENLPPGAHATVLMAWVLGGFGGGLVGTYAAELHGLALALLVGLVDVLLVGAMVAVLPHPGWMVALGLLLPLPASMAGGMLAQRWIGREPERRMPPG